VVEDDEHVGYLLEFMLSRAGIRVVMARDGRAAAEYIDGDEPVDVVLPYKDGFELLTLLRSRPAWSDVPVIVPSARTLERDVVRGLEAGAVDYVTKPYNPRELMARIRRHTQRVCPYDEATGT
jgi:two-component system alkaline phosphatase synthesis response regulator PhoP